MNIESTSIGCSQGPNDSGNLRSRNNILVCFSNAEENSRIEETTENDALEHLTLKERRKMLLERCSLISFVLHLFTCMRSFSV